MSWAVQNLICTENWGYYLPNSMEIWGQLLLAQTALCTMQFAPFICKLLLFAAAGPQTVYNINVFKNVKWQTDNSRKPIFIRNYWFFFFFFPQKFSFSNFFKRPITLKTLANQNQRASLTDITIIYLIVLEIYPNHVYLS